MILPGKELAKYCEKYSKINPAGVDLAPKKIFRYPKSIDYIFLEKNRRGFYIKNEFREVREVLEEVKPINEYWILDPGIYYVVFPRVKVPKDCIGLALPRSSLNRLGIIKSQTALFDPGYEGEFQQLFYFLNKAKIHVDEGWVQIVFIKTGWTGEEYRGYWMGEKY